MNDPQVVCLAYWLWQQRGMPVGSPEADWFLAEELLKRRYKGFASLMHQMPLYRVSMEKRTR